jgi:GNAT superfamily N-acetyltransferase
MIAAADAAAAPAGDLVDLRAEVCGAPRIPQEVASGFARRFGRLQRQPGFVLAEARHGGYLVGYAFGAPLRQATSWWRDLTAPLPEDVTAEPQGRTFALAELTVRAAWRRQGIGRDLHDLVLAGRTEDRATAVIPVAATPAQGAYQRWGWRKAARKHAEPPATVLLDVLLRDLAAGA